MWTLKADLSSCHGLKTCGNCSLYLNGFIQIHGGDLLISDFFLGLNRTDIVNAIESCPAQCIALSRIS